MHRIGCRPLALPELNLAFFSFLLHFVWEMWQIPFYAGVPAMSHWAGVATCTQASLGDAAMAVLAYWTAAVRGSRAWFLRPNRRDYMVYLGVGVGLTIVFEWLATGPLERWSYDPAMPRVPMVGTGLLPLLQWLVIPPIALGLTVRQILGNRA